MSSQPPLKRLTRFQAEVSNEHRIHRLQNQGQEQQAGAGNKGILLLLGAPAPGFHVCG